MTVADDIARQVQDSGYTVIPGLMSQEAVTAAKAELGGLLDDARWGSGFGGTRTKRAWAPLAVTRRMDQAALAPLVLDAVEHAIGSGAQFGNTCAIQVHPGQKAQVLHYEQGIYPLPRDRDVMITALWALDDFTADNGATRVVPGTAPSGSFRHRSSRAGWPWTSSSSGSGWPSCHVTSGSCSC
jgi:ectoine hydroxylase-related dioxygenase (phytanoyl-CoA dioxygenase family)